MVNIKQLMGDYSITQRQMAEIIECTQSEVSFFSNGKRRLGARHIEALVAYFGQDVIDSYTTPATPVVPQVQQATVTIFDPCSMQSIKEDVKCECSIPMVSNVILSQRSVDLYEYVQTKGSELATINPFDLVEGADFVMEILKDSMIPDLAIGDKVFLQFLPKEAKLHSGGIYFIDTPNYAGLVRDVFIDGNIMTLKARNPKYGDIILDTTKDKFRAANLVGFFRNNFNSSFSYLQKIYNEKDQQVQRMIDVMEHQAEQQGKLIDFITNDKK